MGGFYTPEPLSAKLIKYKDNVYGKESTFTSAADGIASEINSANTDFSSAASGVSGSVQDAQGAALTSCLSLVSEACVRMGTSVTSDIGAICAKCTGVDGTLDEIMDLQDKASKIPRSLWIEEAWDDLGHFIAGHWNNSNHGQFQKLNQEIQQKIKLCEAKIDAIAQASYQISLGIDHSNMVQGGSLGSYVSFDSVYSFNEQQWLNDNPIVNLNILQQAGCLVVGAVEGVGKIVEGIVDCGATLVGGVVSAIGSLFNWDAAKKAADSIKGFVQEDWVGKGAAAVGKLITGSEAGYKNSLGAKAGNFVGSAVGHGVLWCIPGGALISAASIAGNKMEQEFQNGNSYGGAIFKGALYGAASYGLGKALPHVMNGASTVAKNATAKAGAFLAKHPTLNAVTKVVSAPIRWAGRGASKVLNAYNKTVTSIAGKVTGSSWYQNSTVAQRLANAEKAIDNAGGRVANRVESWVQGRQLDSRLAAEAEIRAAGQAAGKTQTQINKEIEAMRKATGGHARSNARVADEANASAWRRAEQAGYARNGYVTDATKAAELEHAAETFGHGTGHIADKTGAFNDTLNGAINRGTMSDYLTAAEKYVGSANWNRHPVFQTTITGGQSTLMAEGAQN